VVYARDVSERTLTFDFAEGLLNDNLLLVDRETGSVWSQLAGGAVSGRLEGTRLDLVPAIQTTWSTWVGLHPGTDLMVVPGEEGRPYLYRDRVPGTPPPDPRPTGHDISALGLGLAVGGEARFYPLQALLGNEGPLVETLGGEKVTIHTGPDGLSAWAENAAGELLPAVLLYRRGWANFFPDSSYFGLPE
jgi:Protein of unknown function (DUF3179)